MSEERLRILMVAPTPFFADRGCHVRIYEEACSLIARGHSVHIVTYHVGRDMPGISTSRIPRIPWYHKLEAGPTWHKAYLDILLLYSSFMAARRFHPHILHAHLHEGALIGFLLKKILKLPLLFDYQGSLAGESLDHGFMPAGGFLHRVLERLETFINGCSDHMITSASAAVQQITETGNLPATRVTPFPDGVDTGRFIPMERSAIRRSLGIAEDAMVVVYLGLMNGYQGLDLLLDVIATLKARDRRIHFLVMGFPDAGYRLKAAAMNIENSITFTGRVDYADAPRYLCAGDMAVSPKLSYTEANGKLYNYMACGLPTIAFDTPVNREILGDAGCYASYGSAPHLADVISSLADDCAGRERLSGEVRARAVNMHSWNSRAAQLEEIYRKVIASPGERR